MKSLTARPMAGHIAAMIAGALLPLGLAPFNLWILAILSCGLLNFLLQALPPGQVFRRCLAYGLGMFGTGVSWVFISIHTYGGESVAISLLLTSLLVILLALCFAVPFSLFGLFSQSIFKRLFLFPAMWLLVEWIRGWIFTGFPWLYLGNAFIDTWLSGWAPVTGVLGMGLIGTVTAATLFEFFQRDRRWLTKVGAAATVTLLWIGGFLLYQIPWTRPAGEPLTLAMVQPALTPSQKWDSQILYDILVQLRDLSADHWHNDLMIWPESAIPMFREEVEPFIQFLEEITKETGGTLITGIPIRKGDHYYNGIILLGKGEGTYRKRHLVPFGEYLPLDSVLRGVINFFNRPMSSFSAGPPDQPLLRAHNTTIAAAICYEIVYQDLVAFSAKNAQIILTLSNDVWFGDSIAPHQHLQMARLRAIENGKPVVRDTNDGITAVIDAHGKITHRFPQFVSGTLEAEVTPYKGHTPFNYCGSWPVVILSGVLVIFGAAIARRHR